MIKTKNKQSICFFQTNKFTCVLILRSRIKHIDNFIYMSATIKQCYKTLDLTDDATISKVKQQFRKLALLHHPDKNKTNNLDNVSKFIEIHNAYKNIVNYHNFMIAQQNKHHVNNTNSIYDLFKPIVSDRMPFINDFFKTIYNNETELRNDVDNVDLMKIYDAIKNKFNFDKDEYCDKSTDDSQNDLHIFYAIDVSIKDKYLNNIQNIKIERKTRPVFEYKLSTNSNNFNDIYDNYCTIENEGEMDSNGNVGNILVFMNIVDDDDFVLIGNDICHKIKIDLYTYLYGGNVVVEYFDDDIEIQISSNGLINKKNEHVINNKGINGGNLIVSFEIVNLMEIKDEIKKICCNNC